MFVLCLAPQKTRLQAMSGFIPRMVSLDFHICSMPVEATTQNEANNHPAVVLAAEYGFAPWIEALIDPTPVINERSRIASPARSTPTADDKIAGTPERASLRRSTRSASPSKRTPRKTTRKSLAPKVESALKNEVTGETTEVKRKGGRAASEEVGEDVLTKKKPIFKMPKVPAAVPEESGNVKVAVESTTETNGITETTQTKVKVEVPKEFKMPETTEEMIAKAKEMVEAARELDAGAGVVSAKAKGRKRKVEEVEEVEDRDGGIEGAEPVEGDAQVEAQPNKKVKLESEIRKEKIRTRALIGLSATLAIGYVLFPSFLSL